MQYEWDDNKRESNMIKHGFDFAEIECFDWGRAAISADNHKSESRWIAYGYIDGRLAVISFTIRKQNIRIISMRKANKREVRRYGQISR